MLQHVAGSIRVAGESTPNRWGVQFHLICSGALTRKISPLYLNFGMMCADVSFFSDVWTSLKTCFGREALSKLEPSLIRIQNMDQGLSFDWFKRGHQICRRTLVRVCFSFCKWWTFGAFTCFYQHAPRRLCNVQRPVATDNWAAVCWDLYCLAESPSAWLLGPGFTIPFHWLARGP